MQPAILSISPPAESDVAEARRRAQTARRRAILCVLGAAATFAVAAAAVKGLNGSVPVMQVILFRNLLAALLVLLTVAMPQPALAGLALFLFGAGPVLWTIATTTLRQAVTPPPMLGRVSAVVMTATFGARPLGAALGALLAGTGGVEAALAASALLFAAQFATILASPVPGLRALPEDG